jgi:hypothetical protein
VKPNEPSARHNIERDVRVVKGGQLFEGKPDDVFFFFLKKK